MQPCNCRMCIISYIWEKLINDDKHNFYLILEDDLGYINKDLIDKLINNLDKIDYDYINLYCTTCNSYNCVFEIDNLKLCKSIYPLTTAGYIINKSGAEKLIKIFKNNITYHIDISIAVMQHFNKDFKLLKTNPDLVRPTFLDSTINAKIYSPVLFTIDKLHLNFLKWSLNTPTITLFMRYTIPLYLPLLLILLILFKKNKYIRTFIYIELIFCVISIMIKK